MSESGYDIFLSYSHLDKPVARRLFEALESRGLSVWFDERELQPGDSFTKRIQSGLASSRLYLILIGKVSNQAWARVEREAALAQSVNSGRIVVPITIGDALLPSDLDGRLYLQVDESETSINEVVDSIAQVVAR